MSSTSTKAGEILNRRETNKSSQRWTHNNVSDDGMLGAHWNSNCRRSKQTVSNNFEANDKYDSPGNMSPVLQQAGDHQERKQVTLTAGKVRPRSKNRRPDVAVYVPRARRTQQSSPNDVNEEKEGPSNCHAEAEEKGKSKRNKAGMEVYVPRRRRLQQSVQVKRDPDEKPIEDDTNIDANFERDKSSSIHTKQPKKIKKHRTKEHTVHSDDCDLSNDNKDHKDPRRKHKHKSKSSKQGKESPEGETNIHERKCKEKDKRTYLDDSNNFVVQEPCSEHYKSEKSPEGAAAMEDDDPVSSNETWEDEMKFYDCANKDFENTKESEAKANVGITQEEPCLSNEECHEQTVESTKNQGPLVTGLQESHPDVGKASICNESSLLKTSETKNLGEGEIKSYALDENYVNSADKNLITDDDSSEKPRKKRKSTEDVDLGDDRELHQSHVQKVETTAVRTSDMVNSDIPPCDIECASSEFQSSDSKPQDGFNPREMSVRQKSGASKTEVNEKQGQDDNITTDHCAHSVGTASNEKGNEENSDEVQTSEKLDESKEMDKATVSMETEGDGDTWDSLYADDGEALDPKLMEELTAAVGKVTVQKTQFDYYNYQPKDPDLDDDAYDHLVEIYDFPTDLITRDLLVAFREYKDRGFDIKWVDDTHAIGIFSSSIAAQAVLGMKHPLMKVRPISQASKQTKVKAKKCAAFMEPYRPRPVTTAAVARSLVTGALGLKSNLTREQRDEERKKLKEAKEKRRQERQQRKDAWDGSYGKCAMDM